MSRIRYLVACLLICTVPGKRNFTKNFIYQPKSALWTKGETCSDVEGESLKISFSSNAAGLHKERERLIKFNFILPQPMLCYGRISEKFDGQIFLGCGEAWNKNGQQSHLLVTGWGIGIDSLPREFPHMAALGYNSEDNKTLWACGGTLITTEYVLTAAHCLNFKGGVKYVRLGDLNLNSEEDEAAPQSFEVIERLRHPEYHPPSSYHDLGLIKLDKPCKVTPYVVPARLNTRRHLPAGRYSATGWGEMGYGAALADHLQNMILSISSHAECARAYSKISKRRLGRGIDEETQVCAGAPQADTCPGDSGGPLQLQDGGDTVVYGVTSFGVACGVSNVPGVYTKVAPYMPWITSVVTP